MQHHHFHLVADLEDLGRVSDAAPRHVRHVEQPVDAAQVDEGAVIGDVLDRAREHHALGQDGERVLLLLLPLFLQHGAPRKDHVAAPPIELDHLRPDALAHQRPEVLDRAQIHLGSGQEGPDAHVHGQPSLHHLHHAPLHGRPAVVRCGDGVPDLDLVRLVLGEDDQPFVVLLGLEVDLDVVAHLGQRPVTKLLDGDGALALVADVHEDLAVAHLDDVASHHLAFLDVAHATGKPVRHALLGGLIHLPVSAREGLADDVGASHHMDVLLAGRALRTLDRLGDAADEREVVARWLFLGAVGDDEERHAPRVGVAPVPGRLVRVPSADDGACPGDRLVEPRLVFADRLASTR